MAEDFSNGGSSDAGIGALETLIASLGVAAVIWFLWNLATFIPNWALQVHRLQDAGLSQGWSIALLIADIVLGLAVIVADGAGGNMEVIFWVLSAIASITTIIFDVMPSKHKHINGVTALKKNKDVDMKNLEECNDYLKDFKSAQESNDGADEALAYDKLAKASTKLSPCNVVTSLCDDINNYRISNLKADLKTVRNLLYK